ncbi:hypothetical protein C8R44DRAFT_631071 [Mycena epipterygia]|nr:hypothetical protein C8R44DRAFT_631071 [Mycena epipterygia]
MNPFRLAGDLAHLTSKCILIWSIHQNKSAKGKSHSRCTRYLDLGTRFVSIYNTLFKVVYIISAFYVLGLMRWIYPRTPESQMVRRAAGISLVAACLFAFVFNYNFSLAEVLWSFSIALESGMWLNSEPIRPRTILGFRSE